MRFLLYLMTAASLSQASPFPLGGTMDIQATLKPLNTTATTTAATAAVALRAILNTGSPPLSGATGTAIWLGQSAAIRFTAPSDVPGFGAQLREVQLTVGASRYARSALRLSIVEDSGLNSPGNAILEARDVYVPAYDGRVTITASSPGNVYLYPGEIFWIVLDGTAGYVHDAASWLDSVNGVAWTAFNVWQQADDVPMAADVSDDVERRFDFNEGGSDVGSGRWIVERSRSASSVRVLVS